MKSIKSKIVVAFFAFALGAAAFFIWDGIRMIPDAVQTELIGSSHSNNVALQIIPQKTDLKIDEEISLKVVISNNGFHPITLVSPGDGSEHGWRTPVVEWSIIKNERSARHPSEPTPSTESRCGMMNPLESDEVFRFAAGESRELNDWAFLPPFKEPGVYRVVFLYANRPSLQWRDESLLSHNPVALWRAKHGTETTAASNEIIFTVSK